MIFGPQRALCALALWLPSSLVAAQATLVVRDGGESNRAVEVSVDDALRDTMGGSVRHAESLDDLALAAGCAAQATAPECVATIADAANARLVAIEHLARDGAEWRVTMDLRRADGTHVRDIALRCDDASSCASALQLELGEGTEPQDMVEVETHSVVTEEHRISAPRDEPTHETTSTRLPAEPTPATHSIPIVPNALFAGAALLGVGAIVAGGISVAAGTSATNLGVLRSQPQVDQEHALESQSTAALGVGIGMAVLGAGALAAGIITLGNHDGPSVRIGLLDVGLSVSF